MISMSILLKLNKKLILFNILINTEIILDLTSINLIKNSDFIYDFRISNEIPDQDIIEIFI